MAKKTVDEEDKTTLETIVVDDMVGHSDWKKSKTGYITGVSAISNVVKDQVKSVAESVGRVSILLRMLNPKSDIPSLPEVNDDEYDAKERFAESIRLHRMSKGKLIAAQSNAKKSAYLYGVCSIMAVIYLIYGLVIWDKMPITTLMLHIAPIIVFSALTFRAVFANYMFRTQSLPKLKQFLKAGDFMPK